MPHTHIQLLVRRDVGPGPTDNKVREVFFLAHTSLDYSSPHCVTILVQGQTPAISGSNMFCNLSVIRH